MKVYLFPGQGAQFVGMGKSLYNNNSKAREMFEKANKILCFEITKVMFEGTDEDLKQTKVTQPAIFLHSTILASTIADFKPVATAGHSLGEFSALVAAGALSYEDGLLLVSKRALAMQKACELKPSTMAAIVGLDDAIVEKVCSEINDIVVPANYNTDGQLVISGTLEGINTACEQLKAVGAKRAIILNVGGAFHSPLMEPARVELEKAISETKFNKPICPVYQNVDAKSHTDPKVIKSNLIKQLTSPVKWTYIMRNMLADGHSSYIELGPGKVLQGLMRKINSEVAIESISE